MIKLKEKIGYGLGDAASSMFWKIFGMYLLFFYTDVFGISAKAAALMFLLTRIWDAVNDPMMGLIADRTHTRWGKYRPYILWIAIPFAVIGVLTFSVPDFTEGWKLAYAYITYTLMMMIYTAINVPYASLLGVMSKNPKERNTLSSYRMFFAFAGSFVTFLLLQPLIDFFNGGSAADGSVSTEPYGWTMAVAVIGVVCVLLFMLCFRWTKERVKAIDVATEKTSVWKDLGHLLRLHPWWILVATGLMALFFNAIRDTVAIYYFKYNVEATFGLWRWDFVTVYFLVGQAANMIGVALAVPLSNRFGRKQTYIGAMVGASIFSGLFFFVPTDSVAMILGLQLLISVCAGYVLPLLWGMFADIADYQELTTGRRATGLIFSSSSMSQKLGWAIGPALAALLLGMFGYVPDAQQSELASMGINLMMSVIPALACLLAVVGMSFYPLSDKKVKANSIALDQKRSAN